MITSTSNIYNVIWADDECDTLRKDDSVRRAFDDNNIEVLQWAHTSQELKDALETYKDKVDAVIVDGNFSKDHVEYLEPNDISGLIHTTSFIELFNLKRDIPFFLYTARWVLLQEICQNGEIDYFIKIGRLIQKGEISVLVKQIKEEVDHIHSIESMVNKRYQSLLTYVKNNIDEYCAKDLYQCLLDDARDTNFNIAETMFSKLRGVMEKVVDCCKTNYIVPSEVCTLNNFKFFFGGNKGFKSNTSNTTYKPIPDLMPKVISQTVWYLIDIIQDGSHKKDDLSLHVLEYVQETQTPFLFRACLYQTLDIIRWYITTIEKLTSGEIDPSKLYTKE